MRSSHFLHKQKCWKKLRPNVRTDYPASNMEDNHCLTIAAQEVQTACDLILACELFANSPRMSRLLRFLVGKAISGSARDTSEYIIGIEAFDRNPATYSTAEDPTVRVQIGRLRDKLLAYYQAQGKHADIEISIPLGSYMPQIRRLNGAKESGYAKQARVLAMREITCLAPCEAGEPFTRGLQEELLHQLFHALGDILITLPLGAPVPAGNSGALVSCNSKINHLLEGSVRIDAERIRASIRLVDISLGCVAWSEQFDRNVFFAIAHQEELALSICGALKQYLNA